MGEILPQGGIGTFFYAAGTLIAFFAPKVSIGIFVAEDGSIPDVVPDSPAARAGIGPGMRLAAVNGRRWSRDILREAIRGTGGKALELLVENGEFYRSYRLEYSGGERYPRLERDPNRPDLLSLIVRPLAPPPPAK